MSRRKYKEGERGAYFALACVVVGIPMLIVRFFKWLWKNLDNA